MDWNKKEYLKFQKSLSKFSEESYAKFQRRIISTQYPILGIRTPILKKISKKIENPYAFLEVVCPKTFEEVMIEGFVLGFTKMPFQELLLRLQDYIPKIDNWALTDSICANLKAFKGNQEDGLKEIKGYLKSENPWFIRFGIVLLLNYYLNDTYIHQVLSLSKKIRNEDYYVKMANAWLISYCYIKYSNETLPVLLNQELDVWTHNKAIQKMIDSYQVSKEEKEYLKSLKR